MVLQIGPTQVMDSVPIRGFGDEEQFVENERSGRAINQKVVPLEGGAYCAYCHPRARGEFGSVPAAIATTILSSLTENHSAASDRFLLWSQALLLRAVIAALQQLCRLSSTPCIVSN